MLIMQVILFQLFIFVILVVVMRQIISKRVTIDKEQLQKLSEVYMQKERELKEKYEEAQKTYSETISKAKKEATEIRSRAHEEVKAEHERVLEQARIQSEQIIKRAEKCGEQIEKDIDEHIEDIAVQKACDLIGEILPEEIKREMHVKWIKDLINSGFDSLEHMRIPEEIKKVKVATPYKLTKEEISLIKSGIKKYVKHEIDIEEELNEKMVAGITVFIGNVVLDGSVLHQAKGIADRKKG